MTAPSTATRLRAPGVPITLLDGSEHTLRFGMAALVALEDQFGSLGAVQDLLSGLDEHKAVFGPMLDLIAAGLAHEGMTRQRLLAEELVDPAGFEDLAEAVGRAFVQAFPDAAKKAGSSGEAPAATATPPAPGTTGTTSAPSSSDAATETSG